VRQSGQFIVLAQLSRREMIDEIRRVKKDLARCDRPSIWERSWKPYIVAGFASVAVGMLVATIITHLRAHVEQLPWPPSCSDGGRACHDPLCTEDTCAQSQIVQLAA
jgi:hypothetical protein